MLGDCYNKLSPRLKDSSCAALAQTVDPVPSSKMGYYEFKGDNPNTQYCIPKRRKKHARKPVKLPRIMHPQLCLTSNSHVDTEKCVADRNNTRVFPKHAWMNDCIDLKLPVLNQPAFGKPDPKKTHWTEKVLKQTKKVPLKYSNHINLNTVHEKNKEICKKNEVYGRDLFKLPCLSSISENDYVDGEDAQIDSVKGEGSYNFTNKINMIHQVQNKFNCTKTSYHQTIAVTGNCPPHICNSVHEGSSMPLHDTVGLELFYNLSHNAAITTTKHLLKKSINQLVNFHLEPISSVKFKENTMTRSSLTKRYIQCYRNCIQTSS